MVVGTSPRRYAGVERVVRKAGGARDAVERAKRVKGGADVAANRAGAPATKRGRRWLGVVRSCGAYSRAADSKPAESKPAGFETYPITGGVAQPSFQVGDAILG